MLSALVESIANVTRPLRFPGKGRLFDRWVPREGERDVSLFGRFPRRLDLANGQQRQIFMGCFATGVERYFRPLLSAGDTFVDVGANIGYFSMLAASLVGPTGNVFSFEPNPVVFESLRHWISESGVSWARPQRTAVSDSDGVLTLYVPAASEHKDYNVSIVPREGAEAIDVPARPLDRLLDEQGVETVQLMKVDVEGSEQKVFAGASSLKSGRVRHLICELNAYYLKELGSSQAALVEKIRGLDFIPARISRGHAVPDESSLTLSDVGDPDGFFIHQTAIGRRNRGSIGAAR